MKLQGLHHVSINAGDLELAKEFYVDKLGLTQLERPEEIPVAGLWLDAGGQEIHVLGINEGKPLAAQHFAFRIGNIDEVKSWLQQQGIAVARETEIKGVSRSLFVYDPAGNLVEFNEQTC